MIPKVNPPQPISADSKELYFFKKRKTIYWSPKGVEGGRVGGGSEPLMSPKSRVFIDALSLYSYRVVGPQINLPLLRLLFEFVGLANTFSLLS